MNRDVLVLGGGIAGMQTALLLAEKDHHVYVLESGPAIGGLFPLLDRTFPTNSCGVCFMSPKPPAYCPIHESHFHENIELLTNCELKSLEGQVGDFEVSYLEKPRYVDIEKCTLCNRCVEVCPVEVDRALGGGIEKRKAIYLPFAQAIPRSYLVDEAVCTKCGKCVKVCSPGAINLEDASREKKLNVSAIVLAFGFEPFRGEHKGEYGLGRYKNVVSSIQYERMLSFSGPTEGLPGRPSDGNRPKKVAFIQCVGSRDPSCGQGYCSSICCMYATKQAMVSKDRDRDLDAVLFYMDMRAMGKNYDRYYERAKNEYGIRYIRSAISTVRELQRSKRLLLTYGLDHGELREEEFDMVVLSLGFTPPANVKESAERLGVQLNEYGFCLTEEFKPTHTSVPGIFVAGAFQEPRDIPETVVSASSAAMDVAALLNTFEEKGQVEAPLVGDEITKQFVPRIGVFLCDYKGMLSSALNLDRLAETIGQERSVVCVEKLDVGALKLSLDRIEKKVQEHGLNRAVLAGYRSMELARSARKYETAFGPYAGLFGYVNIGEACADVHRNDPAVATEKAIDLVRGSVRSSRLASPRKRTKEPLAQNVLVVGGGMSGLSSALALADQGIPVTLVEKNQKLGENARSSYYTIKGSDIQALVEDTVSRAEAHPKIDILRGAQLKALEGTWGSYRAVIGVGDEEIEIRHGAVIFATGGKEMLPDEYLLGKNANVVTQRKLEGMLATGNEKAIKANTIVMIQCVGSRDEEHPYCSRICCGHAVKNALKLKERNPDMDVYVLYRDMRTYGFYERYYYEARNKGVIFVQYEPSSKPEVTSENGSLSIRFLDPIVGEEINLSPDLLVLSVGIRPSEDAAQLAEVAGLKLNADGFFAEANPKAAPLDAVDRGKYFCGLCNAPNHLEDSIAQGKAAAARASVLLWEGVKMAPENASRVNEAICVGCGACVMVCPYGAISLDPKRGIAAVDVLVCKGCGTCAVACRSGAIDLDGLSNEQMLSVLNVI